jgi:hypothetical protein
MDLSEHLPEISLPIKIRITIGDVYKILKYPEQPKNPEKVIELYYWEE